MANKRTVTMWPPRGGKPIEVMPDQVGTMLRRGWVEKKPAAALKAKKEPGDAA